MINSFVSRLREESRPIRFLLSRILWRTGLCKFFLIRKDDFVLRFFPSALSASYWVNANERSLDEHFFQRYLRSGDQVVDVGANIGSLSILAARVVGAAGLVHSFEAHPRTVGYLRANIALNGLSNVLVYNVALGESEGSLHFADGRSDDQNRVLDAGGVVVPVKPLDDILAPGPVALLKIDVEGYERFVLAGARECLKQVSCIYFEAWDVLCNRYGYKVADLVDDLRRHGFAVYRFGAAGLAPIEDGYVASRCENLVAVRDLDLLIGRIGPEPFADVAG